jgi:G protein-coupled receptor 157
MDSLLQQTAGVECPADAEYPAIYPGVTTSVKVVMGIACTLSIAAACWVITTYIVFKDLRTTARQLLVNLSIADILVAGSHFVGSIVNYERFIPYYSNMTDAAYTSAHDPLCVGQAAVTMFGSIALFLWIMSIAAYMLSLVLAVSKSVLRVMVCVMYMVCWGVPIPIVVAAGTEKTLGFQITGAPTG